MKKLGITMIFCTSFFSYGMNNSTKPMNIPINRPKRTIDLGDTGDGSPKNILGRDRGGSPKTVLGRGRRSSDSTRFNDQFRKEENLTVELCPGSRVADVVQK